METNFFPTVNFAPGDWLLRAGRGATVRRGWLGRRYVYLLGPRANEFVFGHDHLFRWREAFASLIPVDGETSVVVSDGEAHGRRRGLVRPALDRRHVDGYVDAIARTAAEALDAVRPGELVDGYQVLRAAIRRATMRALFGESVGGHADDMGDLLKPLIDLTDLLPDTVAVHRRLRTPRWRRAMAVRRQLDAFIGSEIARARAGDAPPDRVLSTLVHGRDGSGPGLSETEIRDQMVTLIAAGYETTSAAMAWTLYGLAVRPDLVGRATEEASRACEIGLTASAMGEMEWVGAIVREALRLYPPAVVSARYVAEDFTVEGRRVRAGTMLLYSPYATHRDPRVYDEPLAFRPERWLCGATRPASEYLPFGGGGHRCLGSTMATTELTVMLATLLARGGYQLEAGRVRARGYAAMRPRDGLPMRLG